MKRPSDWPDEQTVIAKARRGVIDDRTAALTMDDLEALARMIEEEEALPRSESDTPTALQESDHDSPALHRSQPPVPAA
jgi:hypothetical protein